MISFARWAFTIKASFAGVLLLSVFTLTFANPPRECRFVTLGKGASQESYVSLWQTSGDSVKLLRTLPPFERFRSLWFGYDSRLIAVSLRGSSADNSNRLLLFDGRNGKLLTSCTFPFTTEFLGGDVNSFYTADPKGPGRSTNLLCWQISNGKHYLKKTLSIEGDALLSHNGRWFVWSHQDNNSWTELEVLDLRTFSVKTSEPLPEPLRGFSVKSWSPDDEAVMLQKLSIPKDGTGRVTLKSVSWPAFEVSSDTISSDNSLLLFSHWGNGSEQWLEVLPATGNKDLSQIWSVDLAKNRRRQLTFDSSEKDSSVGLADGNILVSRYTVGKAMKDLPLLVLTGRGKRLVLRAPGFIPIQPALPGEKLSGEQFDQDL